MNGDERQLITGLFDRMRGYGRVDKDRDAEALIADQVRSIPDAPYMLVQSVLVQEHALQQAAGRIEELEARVRELETRAPAAPQSGGFLGGMFGGGRSSVPQTGRSAVGAGPASPGFGQRPGMGQPGMGQPGMGQPGMGQPGGSPWGGQPGMQPQRAGGGFLQSAMATAAGVAGGMLLANSISSMMGGSSAEAATADAGGAAAAEPAADTAAPAEDPMMQDAGWDDAGGDMGGEFEL